jgi:release factor glutamine methyltransferase
MAEVETLAQALLRARALGVERLDAQGLLAYVLGRDRSWILAHDDLGLDARAAERFAELAQRRAAGEPYAYLVGEREFHGLSLRVTPQVLIPRPDTETLVDWALECLAGPLAGVTAPRVLDLGTGSGAIALAIRHACARAQLCATDVSEQALAVAAANGQRLGLQVQWLQGDWWHALGPPAPHWHLVLSNPPYVAAGDPHLRALGFEPTSALVPQRNAGDGLGDLAHIVAGAPGFLAEGAWLMLEHGSSHGAAVRRLLEEAGFAQVRTRPDLGGNERVTAGVHRP